MSDTAFQLVMNQGVAEHLPWPGDEYNTRHPARQQQCTCVAEGTPCDITPYH